MTFGPPELAQLMQEARATAKTSASAVSASLRGVTRRPPTRLLETSPVKGVTSRKSAAACCRIKTIDEMRAGDCTRARPFNLWERGPARQPHNPGDYGTLPVVQRRFPRRTTWVMAEQIDQ